jgi:glycosyltransferase involved in cell wall biosynthesis
MCRSEGAIRFESMSVVVPVINEVHSLIDTVNTIVQVARGPLHRIIIVVCEKTTPESLRACERLREAHGEVVEIVWQQKPFLGGALQAGLAHSKSSHVVLMYSDGESDPRTLGELIAEARRHPAAIISASRWLKRDSFYDYPPGKLLANYCFQRLFALIYGRRDITDFTFGYRLYPQALVNSIPWEETGHPCVFESIVKPLRLDMDVREIPTRWKQRSEGVSQVKLRVYWRYLVVGAKVRWAPPSRILTPRRDS